MTRKLSREEVEVARQEAWERIWGDLKDPVGRLYLEASEAQHNIKAINELAGPKAALTEMSQCIGAASAAVKKTQRMIIAHASECGIPDTDLAENLGLHRHTVKKWRREYEAFMADQLIDPDEVARNSE